jgi:hypothetical protein
MNWARLLSTASLLACISTTAAADPRQDLKSFLLGEKASWDSTGHPKAKGIRMKISYPKTWAADEDNRPHIAQMFTSEAGRGLELFMVLIKPLPEFPYGDYVALNKEEKKEVLREIAMLGAPEGGRLLSFDVTQIEGEDCAMYESEHVGGRAGMTIGQRMLTFAIPREGALLLLQGSVGGDATNGLEEIGRRYVVTKPLLQQIAASCVLTDKYTKEAE